MQSSNPCKILVMRKSAAVTKTIRKKPKLIVYKIKPTNQDCMEEIGGDIKIMQTIVSRPCMLSTTVPSNYIKP